MDYNTEWRQKISMHDYVKVEDYVYFFALNFNGLYRMKPSEKRLELLGCVPGEAVNQKHMYGAIAESGGKLYLPPRNGKGIAVFNRQEKVFEKIPLEFEEQGLPFKFSDAVTDKGRIFLIPARYPHLIVLDTETGVLNHVDSWIKKLYVPDGYGGLLVGRGSFVKDGFLYMAAMTDNILIKLSTVTMEAEMIQIGDEKNGFTDMCLDQDGENIWFVQKRKPAILKWAEHSGEYIVYDTMPIGMTHGEVPFVNVIEESSKITAIGYHANMSVEVDKVSGVVRQAKWDTAGLEGAFNAYHARHYFAKKIAKESFLVSNIDDHSFNIIEDGNKRERFYLTDDSSDVALVHFQKKAIQENGIYSLQKFLNFVAKRNEKE